MCPSQQTPHATVRTHHDYARLMSTHATIPLFPDLSLYPAILMCTHAKMNDSSHLFSPVFTATPFPRESNGHTMHSVCVLCLCHVSGTLPTAACRHGHRLHTRSRIVCIWSFTIFLAYYCMHCSVTRVPQCGHVAFLATGM